MTAYNQEFKLSYYSNPKVACTSLKSIMFEIENGFPFRSFCANGSKRHIHHFYPTKRFDLARTDDNPANTKFAVIRDPIDRFLSAYSNRVLQHDELSEQSLMATDNYRWLTPRPSITAFIDNLDAYRHAVPSIMHHTQLQTFFLGSDPKYYSRIFEFFELTKVEQFLSEVVGKKISIPHHQRSKRSATRDQLSGREIKKLMKVYEEDYACFFEVLT